MEADIMQTSRLIRPIDQEIYNCINALHFENCSDWRGFWLVKEEVFTKVR